MKKKRKKSLKGASPAVLLHESPLSKKQPAEPAGDLVGGSSAPATSGAAAGTQFSEPDLAEIKALLHKQARQFTSLSRRCPQCGNHLPEADEQDEDGPLRAKAEELRADLEAKGHAVLPGGRVHEPAAAAVLGAVPATLRNWRNKLSGPGYLKAGGRIVYDLVDLARFVERR